jgi:hypothetical protein
MAHNVPAVYDVFASPIKETAGFQGSQKCGGEKPRKRRSLAAVFRSPSRPSGGEAYTDLLCAVPPDVIDFLSTKLTKAAFLAHLYSDDSITKFPGAVLGNKVYAFRQEERIRAALKFLRSGEGSCLWLTLTTPYEKNNKSRKASWEGCQERLQPFLRTLRNIGMDAYISVKEAHRNGGCHVHAVIRWSEELPYEKSGDKYLLCGNRGEEVRAAIKEAWGIGWADVQVVADDRAGEYLVKELGKAGHIEDALRRAKRDWRQDGDARFKDRDCKKLWAIYYAARLKIRRVTTSRNLPSVEVPESDEEPEADLINTMTNTTESENKPSLVKVLPIPWEIKKQAFFEPYTGKVSPESEEYRLLIALLKPGGG